MGNWILFGIWFVLGLVRLCVPVEVTKLDYGLIWFAFVFNVLCDAIMGVLSK